MGLKDIAIVRGSSSRGGGRGGVGMVVSGRWVEGRSMEGGGVHGLRKPVTYGSGRVRVASVHALIQF